MPLKPENRGRLVTAGGVLLSRREQQILTALWAGQNAAEVGETLEIAPATVRNAVSGLSKRMGLRRARLIIFWERAQVARQMHDRQGDREEAAGT